MNIPSTSLESAMVLSTFLPTWVHPWRDGESLAAVGRLLAHLAVLIAITG